MTAAEAELRLIEVDRLLDELHLACPQLEGYCWCCCMACDPFENDDAPAWADGARAEFWRLVRITGWWAAKA